MIQIIRPNIDTIIAGHYTRIMENRRNSPGLLTRLKNKQVGTTGRLRLFYNELIRLMGTSVKDSLITMNPPQLQQIATDLKVNFHREMSNALLMKLLLDKIFFYGNYSRWEAYTLAKDLNVTVCPYCNRQYTFTLDGKTGRTRPQFDHFWDKDRYPMFALCFYNLLPCCSICNASLKHTREFTFSTHFHPYQEGFGKNIRFSIVPKDVQFVNGKANHYNIVLRKKRGLDASIASKAEGNIRDFCLEQLYNMHKDYVDEIIIKIKVYNKAYIESLFKQYRGTLFNNIGEVKQMVMGNYLAQEGLDKRVLAKLTADICDELGAFSK